MFREDDLVVYPTQGVGQIERIDHKNIGGADCEFYIVRIRSNNITLMVPVNNAANVGLRPLVSSQKAQSILQTLREDLEKTVLTGQNWNRRFREYSERLKSTDLSVVCEVMRELLLIGRGKELSFGERRLLEQAMNLVCGEVGTVLDMNVENLREEMMTLYAPLPIEEETQESA